MQQNHCCRYLLTTIIINMIKQKNIGISLQVVFIKSSVYVCTYVGYNNDDMCCVHFHAQARINI